MFADGSLTLIQEIRGGIAEVIESVFDAVELIVSAPG